MSGKFCAHCGAALEPGPARAHRHCAACGTISYANPAVFAGAACRLSDGAPALRCAPVLPGESIQAAALRALGAGETTRLAVYCTLTDLEQGAVYVVFRTRDGEFAVAASVDAAPPWAPAMLRQLAADRAAGRLPVYTAAFAAGVLDMDPVATDDEPFSPAPA